MEARFDLQPEGSPVHSPFFFGPQVSILHCSAVLSRFFSHRSLNPKPSLLWEAGREAAQNFCLLEEFLNLRKRVHEAAEPRSGRKSGKKRAASDPDTATGAKLYICPECVLGKEEPISVSFVEDDINEPTIGEKIGKLNRVDGETKMSDKDPQMSTAQLPSADSVIVLLRQALRADDRALLLDCMYTQDEKVIANSVSRLNPSDILKLLAFLVSIVQSRGAVAACALPWLRRLLLQHASGIMSQESSFVGLNSLYQIAESRIATFGSALQLSSCLDLLFSGDIIDLGEDESVAVKPVIFEDKDSDEDESSEGEAMETVDEVSEEEEQTGVLSDGFSDDELAIENMSE